MIGIRGFAIFFDFINSVIRLSSTKEKREEALRLLREYLPDIGITEAEATDAMENLKKKEYEEYYGKESSFSKISKGLGSLFKK